MAEDLREDDSPLEDYPDSDIDSDLEEDSSLDEDSGLDPWEDDDDDDDDFDSDLAPFDGADSSF